MYSESWNDTYCEGHRYQFCEKTVRKSSFFHGKCFLESQRCLESNLRIVRRSHHTHLSPWWFKLQVNPFFHPSAPSKPGPAPLWVSKKVPVVPIALPHLACSPRFIYRFPMFLFPPFTIVNIPSNDLPPLGSIWCHKVLNIIFSVIFPSLLYLKLYFLRKIFHWEKVAGVPSPFKSCSIYKYLT